MSDTQSQEKGSCSENEDPLNPENITEYAETRDESATEHVNNPMTGVISYLKLRVMENLQEKRDLGIPRKKKKIP